MSKILIVPDVHGRKFWNKAEELIDGIDQVVFLGDYLDPYSHEGITFEDSVKEFKQILSFKDKHTDKVTLLIGNHDCHYIIPSFMDCSRLNTERRNEIHNLYCGNLDKFQLIYIYQDKWLFSHAGVYSEWLSDYNISLKDLENCKEFLASNWESLESLSHWRGGWNYVGSCVWADIRESINHELEPNYKHIVGHTQLGDNPYYAKNVSCLDVRRCFILDTDTDTIQNA